MDERDPGTNDEGVEDLEASDEEASGVTGGRMADPCEGGE